MTYHHPYRSGSRAAPAEDQFRGRGPYAAPGSAAVDVVPAGAGARGAEQGAAPELRIGGGGTVMGVGWMSRVRVEAQVSQSICPTWYLSVVTTVAPWFPLKIAALLRGAPRCEVILHVSVSDAVLLSLLFRSLSAGARAEPPEATEPPPEPRRSVVEVVANGISLRLLHASAGRGEVRMEDVDMGYGMDMVVQICSDGVDDLKHLRWKGLMI